MTHISEILEAAMMRLPIPAKAKRDALIRIRRLRLEKPNDHDSDRTGKLV